MEIRIRKFYRTTQKIGRKERYGIIISIDGQTRSFTYEDPPSDEEIKNRVTEFQNDIATKEAYETEYPLEI